MQHATFECSMLLKDEGVHLPVPDAFHLQQLHSRNNMAEKEKDKPRAVKCIYQLWNFIHTTLHLLKKDNRASEKIKFIHCSKQRLPKTPLDN